VVTVVKSKPVKKLPSERTRVVVRMRFIATIMLPIICSKNAPKRIHIRKENQQQHSLPVNYKKDELDTANQHCFAQPGFTSFILLTNAFSDFIISNIHRKKKTDWLMRLLPRGNLLKNQWVLRNRVRLCIYLRQLITHLKKTKDSNQEKGRRKGPRSLRQEPKKSLTEPSGRLNLQRLFEIEIS
jgi:hypothetical protein